MPFDPIPRFLKLLIIENATWLFLLLVGLAAFGVWQLFKAHRSNGRARQRESAMLAGMGGEFAANGGELYGTEHRIAKLEERLAFTERLLESRPGGRSVADRES